MTNASSTSSARSVDAIAAQGPPAFASPLEPSEDNNGRYTTTTACCENAGEISRTREDELSIPSALSPDEHQALELMFSSGLMMDEIAKRLDQSIGEIKAHLR